MFLRQYWYVIAWDHEIPEDGLFSRTVLGEPILVYRTAGGLTALEDRCCHRLAPLSAGRKEGDCVRCGYHGLKFDASGRCVEIPGSDRVPAAARVRRYPVALRNRWVFVWMGDPARADPALLPDNFSCDHPEWHYRPGYMHYDVDHRLICDNLLDFSHLSWVHEKTLGGSPLIAQARAEIESVPRGIRVSRRVPSVPAPPYYQRFRRFDGPVDRWFIYDFLVPGILLMHSGGRPAEDRADDLSRAVRLHSCQALTPETAGTTHYFFQQAHHGAQEDTTVAELIFDSLKAAFHEDREMIRAQSRVIAARPDAPMLTLAMDAALVQYRRLVDGLLTREGLAEQASARLTDPPGG
jgi:phenylpropionate dioxygenase-like ring-hydroxylating dioxygenase large terminal subunit